MNDLNDVFSSDVIGSDTPSTTDYIRALVNILEDIGDEKQRLEATQKAVLNILEDLDAEKRSAQEANRMKSEFLANMSHELRTPLNSIIGFSELMSDGKVGPIADNHKEYLGDILTSARHLLQLINDVLDLAKVEAGKLDFDAKPIDLDNLVHGIRDTLRSIAASRNISVDVNIGNNLGGIIGDPARLKQVLYNYLSNALKFTSEGGHVCITANRENDEFFKLSVRDTGEGIAPENLARLFVEFEQLDASIGKRHQGTGLGLALSKRIVEAQGGQIGVESRIGEGSNFFAILPMSLGAESIEEPRAVRSFQDTVLHLPQVLVIEDDPIERNAIVQLLTSVGYAPHGVATGEAALESSRNNRWDAITLDLNLPDISGAKVLAQIRAESLNAATPVVVVTALPDNLVRAFSVQEMLTKPINTAELVAALKRAEKLGFRGRNIMVVDDEPNDLKLMEKHLQDSGYLCTGFPSGEQALAALTRIRPDMIILDLVMPGMGGLALLKKLQQGPQTCHIPVIIWSETESSDDTIRNEYAAAVAYISKADGHKMLMQELQQYLPKHQ